MPRTFVVTLWIVLVASLVIVPKFVSVARALPPAANLGAPFLK